MKKKLGLIFLFTCMFIPFKNANAATHTYGEYYCDSGQLIGVRSASFCCMNLEEVIELKYSDKIKKTSDSYFAPDESKNQRECVYKYKSSRVYESVVIQQAKRESKYYGCYQNRSTKKWGEGIMNNYGCNNDFLCHNIYLWYRRIGGFEVDYRLIL